MILYIMLSYVLPWSGTPHSRLASGSHPFDNDTIFDSSSDWLSHIQASHCSQVSNNYHRNEARLKAKIIDGDVEFPSHQWNRLPDGQYPNRPLSPASPCGWRD